MKWFFYSFFIFTFLLENCLAQDTLYFNSKNKLEIKLLEVNPDNIKYKKTANLNGPTYTISKSEVEFIVFENGSKEIFTVKNTANLKSDSIATDDNFFDGDIPDTLYFKSGKKTIAKILIINSNEIRYKLFDFQDGPTYQANKSELKSLTRGNGKVLKFEDELVNVEKKTTQNSNQNNNQTNTTSNDYSKYTSYNGYSYSFNQQLYEKGKQDARRFYKHKGGSIGVGCAAAGCGPVLGLIPALIVADNEPKSVNLNIPPSQYSTHTDYLKGYREEAMRMKKKRVWNGYGIGAGLITAFVVLIYAIAILSI
jgi:hypothetical protein